MQAASRAAWDDEAHVRDNRRLYREKFAAFTGILRGVTPVAHAGRRLLPLAAHADAPTPSSRAACTQPTT